MKFLKYAFVAFLSVGMMSCGGSSSGGDEVDEENPEITINLPKTGTPETAGEDLIISASLTDNMELKSYVLTIVNTKTKSLKNVDENWSFDSRTTDQDLPSIAGTSASLSITIAIPDDVQPNNYKLELTVTDGSGNSSDTKSVTFEIE